MRVAARGTPPDPAVATVATVAARLCVDVTEFPVWGGLGVFVDIQSDLEGGA